MSMSARKINEETELQPQLRSRPLAATFIMAGSDYTYFEYLPCNFVRGGRCENVGHLGCDFSL